MSAVLNSRLWSLGLLAATLVALLGCDPDPVEMVDAAMPDAGREEPSADHCAFEPLPPTARAGGTVQAGTVYAGVAERLITMPIGTALGAYTARSEGFGGAGFVDARRSGLGGGFASSVGIETWPRVRALAIATGRDTAAESGDDELVIIVKADVGAAWQGITHALEARLGPDYSGKILFATSHSHSAFANFTGHSALQVGFGQFRSSAYDALMDDMEAAIRAAVEDLQPARIGFAYDGAFDMDDQVTRDRRDVNDDLAGGSFDDHHLYVIRVDRLADPDPIPLALVPVFGMHGTIHGEDNVMVSTDSIGGLERVLEESFDTPVMVMHLQGAGGDVSPAGLGSTDCGERILCSDFARAETIGWRARDAVLAAWTSAEASMVTSLEAEMVTRSVARGYDAERFTVRDGELSYAPFDLRREADGVVFNPDGTIASPIDEFNAPFGAALCGNDSLLLPYAVMPGTRMLTDTPYPTCLMLQRVERVFEAALDIDLETPPMCDTLRTTVSALRLGDHILVTLPGEPVTLLVDRLRSLVATDTAHTIVVGYAQDHGGYMMTAEDWLAGGYEPNITFWGPLEGEAIMESAVALVPLAMSPEREDATLGGTDRVSPPDVSDAFVSDPAPRAGEVPAAVPAYLLTRESPAMPPSTQPASLARLDSTFFTWIGEDPLEGTPLVSLEFETAPDVWETVTRRSGRPVSDGEMLLTHTPDPLNPRPGTERVHYYTMEWQAVTAVGQPGLGELADRAGVPLGRYRFVVEGPSYTVVSAPFEVTPGAILVAGSIAGGNASLMLTYHAPDGYRLLDGMAGATRPVPLRGDVVSAVVTYTDASPDMLSDLAVGMDGSVRVPVAGSVASITITDRFGNTGSFSP